MSTIEYSITFLKHYKYDTGYIINVKSSHGSFKILSFSLWIRKHYSHYKSLKEQTMWI